MFMKIKVLNPRKWQSKKWMSTFLPVKNSEKVSGKKRNGFVSEFYQLVEFDHGHMTSKPIVGLVGKYIWFARIRP